MNCGSLLKLAIVLVAMLAMNQVSAQRFGGRFAIQQNEPPATEFIAARWRFGTNGRIGHMGWVETAHIDEALEAAGRTLREMRG